MSFLIFSQRVLYSSLPLFAYFTLDSSSKISRFFCPNSCLSTLKGLSSTSFLRPKNLEWALSSLVWQSPTSFQRRLLSASIICFSSLNFFLMFIISSSFPVSCLLTSMIFCLSSSSRCTNFSSRRSKSVAFCLILFSSVQTLLHASVNFSSLSDSFLRHSIVTYSILLISCSFKCTLNLACSDRFHISSSHTIQQSGEP